MTNTDGRSQRPGAGTSGANAQSKGAELNRKIVKGREGLERAVTGREEMIRKHAANAAKRLDAKTEGRHREKLRVALHVVDFVVDRFGAPSERSQRSVHRFDPESAKAGATGAQGKPAADEPEDLGEFTAREKR